MLKNSANNWYRNKIQHWVGNKHLSMDVTYIELFTNTHNLVHKNNLNSIHIIENNEQDACDSYAHIVR